MCGRSPSNILATKLPRGLGRSLYFWVYEIAIFCFDHAARVRLPASFLKDIIEAVDVALSRSGAHIEPELVELLSAATTWAAGVGNVALGPLVAGNVRLKL